MNPPNIISPGRLLISPIIVLLMMTGAFEGALWLFLLAAFSDALDGAIAKRFDMVTLLGGYLDPIADKVMLVSVFLVLGSLGHLPLWIVLLVVSRDALIVGGALLLWMLARSPRMKPLMISKVNTVCQIVLAVAVLAQLGLGLPVKFTVTSGAIVDILMVVVATTTLTSGASYLVAWARNMNHTEAENEK
ncbi:MAG: CDP-alcohol phosphatidyltransferase family protein [Proteobacteria bacterium]|nr:CDP-alcohol phosphatidyltransferase family protein [Pseudomonadota bacterium]